MEKKAGTDAGSRKPRITLVATSHVAQESILRIREVVEKENPDCIAVELDAGRYYAMQTEGEAPSVRQLGLGNYVIFSLMKKIQDWIGKRVGIFPGSEMLSAIEIGKERGIQVVFIDRSIQETFLRMNSISGTEKLNIIWLLLKGMALTPFAGLAGKGIDLRKVPDDKVIEEAMRFLEREMPGFYRVIVKERDMIMAANLLKLSTRFENIIAVVGAGHKRGMMTLLKGRKSFLC